MAQECTSQLSAGAPLAPHHIHSQQCQADIHCPVLIPAPVQAAPIAEVVPLVAPMEAPFEAPFEVPLGAPPVEAPGPVAVTPEEVEFPEEVEYPEEVEIEYPEEVEVEVPEEVEAPEEVEVPEEVEMPEAEEPDAAEVPEEVSVEEPESALVIEEAGGTLQDLFTTDVEDCGPVMSEIPTGKHLPTLKAPEEAISYYGDKLKDGEFEMPYGEIEKGGEYCVSPGSTAPKVIFGGMVFWHNDDQCHLPPTKQDGSACCELFMWQPNTEGYYYDNCSMKCDPRRSLTRFRPSCMSGCTPAGSRAAAGGGVHDAPLPAEWGFGHASVHACAAFLRQV